MSNEERNLEFEATANKILEIREKIDTLSDKFRDATVRKNSTDRLSIKEKIVELTQIADIYKEIVNGFREILAEADELLDKFGNDALNQSKEKIIRQISIIEEQIITLDQTVQDAHQAMADQDLKSL